jgi:glycosyltransferase involved in cell wall biosynthesis
MPSLSREIRRIGVVVPAHDEQDLLPACLASLLIASLAAAVSVDIVVVLDDCSDGSERVVDAAARAARAHPAIGRLPIPRHISVAGRNVGRARAAGMNAILAGCPDDLPGTWLASTDADSVVPPTWLTWQCALAEAGAHAVIGRVRVSDWSEHPTGASMTFARDYERPRARPHVHGANLGIVADAYQQVGGFPPLALAEDHGLVDALVRSGHRVLCDPGPVVVTSARRQPRASGGFGDTVRALTAQFPPSSTGWDATRPGAEVQVLPAWGG